MSRLCLEVTDLVGALMEQRRAGDAGRGLPDVTPLTAKSLASAVREAKAGAVRELWEVRPVADHDSRAPGEPDCDTAGGTVTRRVIYAGASAGRGACGVAGEHALYRHECRPLLIVDGTVAVMAVDGTTFSAIAVGEVPLVALLRSYFDVLWSQSVRCGHRDVPSPVAVRVLALLSSGYRDDVAARALGLSVRTVRRHVAEAARRLNVTTRFAIGFHAYLKGWVSAPEEWPTRRSG